MARRRNGAQPEKDGRTRAREPHASSAQVSRISADAADRVFGQSAVELLDQVGGSGVTHQLCFRYSSVGETAVGFPNSSSHPFPRHAAQSPGICSIQRYGGSITSLALRPVCRSVYASACSLPLTTPDSFPAAGWARRVRIPPSEWTRLRLGALHRCGFDIFISILAKKDPSP